MLFIKSRESCCVIVMVCFFVFAMVAKESEKWVKEKVNVVKVGNFALPISQQPAPLFSFGQNLVDKGDFLAYGSISQLKGPQSNFVSIVPSILYGVTEKLSLFSALLIAEKFKYQNTKSDGVGDLVVQLEQVLYAKETPTSVNVVTIVGNITLPTGSASKNPPAGFGSPAFFIGATVDRTTTDWYYFTSWGGLITTMNKQNKPGNTLFYQFGVSKNIAYRTDGWILNWMVEFDGLYRQRNKIGNSIDPNTGGNSILVGPSLSFATRRFELHGGVEAVVAQHLFGRQSRDHYFAAAYVGWKF